MTLGCPGFARWWNDHRELRRTHGAKAYRHPVEANVNEYQAYEGQLDGSTVAWGPVHDPDHEAAHADFSFEVTDPRYLAHMGTHASFETAFTGHLSR